MAVNMQILGDKLNMKAEEMAQQFGIHKCLAMSIIAQTILDEDLLTALDLEQKKYGSKEDREMAAIIGLPGPRDFVERTVRKFVLASCLNNNEIIFEKP